MCDKRELRKKFRALRAAERSAQKDEKIKDAVLKYFSAYESYFVYLSIGTEVGTEELIRALKARGKTICAPRIEGREMLSVELKGELEVGAYGIPAPGAGEERACEVALTPLLAADGEGYRLGYGGGYYDRYFERRPEAVRVGLCYEAQLTDRLPREEGDVPLDFLVTETRILKFGAERLTSGARKDRI